MPSWRVAPLPRGWERKARRILRRDAYVCYVCRQYGADQVDHIVPVSQGGTDAEDNLAAIHDDPCHRVKTSREAHAAKIPRLRAVEAHPGSVRKG